MKKVGLETTDEEIWCLFLGINPKDLLVESTVNISAESPVAKAIARWESQPRVKILLEGNVPMSIIQLLILDPGSIPVLLYPFARLTKMHAGHSFMPALHPS